MALTPKDYEEMGKKASPPSRLGRNMLLAFLVGGLICTLGEFFINLYTSMGAEKELAAGGASVTLVFLSALFTGLKLYDNLARYAGAGTLVPITGFANAVAAPALEFKSDDRVIIGTSQKHHEIKVDVLV